MRSLVRYGGDLNAPDCVCWFSFTKSWSLTNALQEGKTPLHCAIEQDASSHLVEEMITLGVDVNVYDGVSHHKESSIHPPRLTLPLQGRQHSSLHSTCCQCSTQFAQFLAQSRGHNGYPTISSSNVPREQPVVRTSRKGVCVVGHTFCLQCT